MKPAPPLPRRMAALLAAAFALAALSCPRPSSAPVAQAGPEPVRLAAAPPAIPPTALVEAGSFLMGSEDGLENERPVRRVTLTRDVLFAVRMVSFDDWDLYCAATGRPLLPSRNGERGSVPVIHVDWFDAVAYCNWLSQAHGLRPCYSGGGNVIACDWDADGWRLPSEAEWEWAARGGVAGRGHEWSGSDDPLEVAWLSANSGGRMHPGGELAPNGLGIFDMSGNVNEFVFDWSGTAVDQRMLRGGEFLDTRDWAQVGRVDRARAPWLEMTSKGLRVAMHADALFPVPFRVRYDGNGSTGGTVPADSALYVEYYGVASDDLYYLGNPGSLAKTGNAFAGWGVDRDGDGAINDDGSVVLDAFGEYIDVNTNTTLIAQWTPATYSVTYYGNSQTSGTAPAEQSCVYGNSFTVAAKGDLARTGKVFLSWNTAWDGSGTTYLPGQSCAIPAGNLTLYAHWARLEAVSVPAKSFFTGTDDSGSGSVASAFLIGTTEVSYDLWYAVRVWAEGHDYSFANPGRPGTGGTIGAVPGFGTYDKPVTTVNWRDAMVWLNALTEWYNAKTGSALACVYCTTAGYGTPIRSSADGSFGSSVDTTAGSFDNPYVNPAAGGFRLPTGAEWELAARYRTDSNADGDIKDANEYYPGSWASGGWAPALDANDVMGPFGAAGANGVLDGKESNDRYSVYSAYWAGSDWTYLDPGDHDVRSVYANALGLYDMSGNAREWCFDWRTADVSRMYRGGSLSLVATHLQAGYLPAGTGPYGEISDTGIRIARNSP